MAWTRFPITRASNADALNSALVLDLERGNLLALMDESPSAMCAPLTNGVFTSAETAYNDASCFWRENFAFVQASRLTELRGLRLQFRARITAGAGTGTIRVWAGRRFLASPLPDATPDEDLSVASVAGIAGGNAFYDVPLRIETWHAARVGAGHRAAVLADEEAPMYWVTYLGAQLVVSAAGTTAEVSRVALIGDDV